MNIFSICALMYISVQIFGLGAGIFYALLFAVLDELITFLIMKYNR